MAEIGTVTARLRADVSQFNNGMQQAQTQLRSLGVHGEAGARGLHAIRGGLSALASEALGVRGPLSHIAQGLLLFGGGSTLVIGVAAGLAIIGTIMKKLGEDSDKTSKAFKELKTSAEGMIPLGTGEQQRRKLEEVTASIANLRVEIKKLVDFRDNLVRTLGDSAPVVLKLDERIQNLTNSLLHMIGVARGLRGAPIVLSVVDVETGATPTPLEGAQGGAHLPFDWQAKGDIPAIMRGGKEVGGPNAFWKSSKVESQLAKDMKELGVNAMAAFVAGLATGATNFGDLLKSIFSAFLTAGITKVFHVLFKIGSPSGWAKDMGGYLAEGLALGIESGTARVGGASLRLASAVPAGFVGAARVSINPTLPASRSPFDVARDADWLRALGESARELGYRGFKFK